MNFFGVKPKFTNPWGAIPFGVASLFFWSVIMPFNYLAVIIQQNTITDVLVNNFRSIPTPSESGIYLLELVDIDNNILHVPYPSLEEFAQAYWAASSSRNIKMFSAI
jgi:hypothetical protein